MSCLCKGRLCKVDDLLLSRVMHRHTFSSCWKNMNSSMSHSLSSSSLLQVHASWPLFCLCLHKVGIIAAPPLSITISQPLGLTPCLVSDSCRNSISVLGLVILVYIRHNKAVLLIDTGSFVKLRNCWWSRGHEDLIILAIWRMPTDFFLFLICLCVICESLSFSTDKSLKQQ